MSSERGIYRLRKRIEQSNILVLSDRTKAIEVAFESFLENRRQLVDYIRFHPEYEYSLIPLEVELSAPRVAKIAAEASKNAEVGPMAAVPGALADLALEDMMAVGASVCLVENGGEVSARSCRPLRVGVYTGGTGLSGKFGFLLEQEDFPIGISTSSATVSHAINFGQSDATVVFADGAATADAVVADAVMANEIMANATTASGLPTPDPSRTIANRIRTRNRSAPPSRVPSNRARSSRGRNASMARTPTAATCPPSCCAQ